MSKKINKNNNINVNLQTLNSQAVDNHLPPQNIEAEQSVLGALMIDKNAIIRIGDFLKSESFYKRSHQLIYATILELFNQQESIDLLSVSAKLEEKNQLENIGGRTYLAGLVNAVPTSSHVYSYAKIVSKKKVLRDIIDASFYLAQLGYNEDTEIEQILDAAEKKVFSIAQQSFTQEFASIKEPLTEAFARFDRLHQTKDKKLRGVATGFQDLDSRYLSGLQKTDLITLASRPRIGKTSLALDMAQNIALKEKKAVGIFSLEMSTDQLVDRLIAKEGRIDLWKLRTGNLVDHDFDAIQQSLDQLSRAPIYIDDGMSNNVLQMRAMARRLQAQTDLGLIIIDYLQLMEPATKTESRTQEISQISRSLKALARELDVPVLALSQLSRAVEHRSYSIPKLSDLRESGCLAGDTMVLNGRTGKLSPIKELVGESNFTVSCIAKDYSLTTKKAIKIFPTGKKQLYKIILASGKEIRATVNHKFLTLIKWKRLDALEEKGYIATPHKSGTNSKSDIFWEQIVSIKKDKVEEVFDITVPEHHNFIANDIVVHNSIEQDSDVVMFIYREEKAPPEVGLSPEGQVVVAKNRNGPTGNVPVVFKEKWASYESMAKRPGEAEEIEFPPDDAQPPM